jgi:hypothetical protein
LHASAASGVWLEIGERCPIYSVVHYGIKFKLHSLRWGVDEQLCTEQQHEHELKRTRRPQLCPQQRNNSTRLAERSGAVGARVVPLLLVHVPVAIAGLSEGAIAPRAIVCAPAVLGLPYDQLLSERGERW